ncbi:MAG: glycosyltransferase [Planctomycetota bacterium]
MYKTRPEDSETFISLGNSLKNSKLRMDIVVYDNSPTPMATALEGINDNWIIHYIHDKTNPGVSKAYNEGFRIAKRKEKKWMLLLDQDTSFPRNTITEYGKAIHKYMSICLLAPIVISKNRIISPCRYFLNRGYSLRRIEPGIYNCERKSLINSGMLISVDAFEKTGGYNENIRLDFADHSFIGKYKAIYNRFAVIDLRCFQDFSSDRQLTISSALIRFAFYCEGARNKAVNKLDYLVLMLVVLFRSGKLSLKYMSLKFFIIYYNKFLFGNPKEQK